MTSALNFLYKLSIDGMREHITTERQEKLLKLSLLILDERHTRALGEVTSQNIFTPNSTVFDPKGLFSTEIFGPLASKDRTEREGWINLRVPLMHPVVYQVLINMKKGKNGNNFYQNILAGKVKARFDEKLGDFVLDNTGDTGYEFFIKHKDNIVFTNDSGSTQKDFYLRLLDLYKDTMVDKHIVIPAGMRDYMIKSDGTSAMDEINNLYRALLRITNNIRNSNIDKNKLFQYDIIRYKLQIAMDEIFEHIFRLIEGKDGYIQDNFAGRNVMHGGRNVITANTEMITDLDKDDKITTHHTVCGLYQFVTSAPQLAMYHIINEFVMTNLNTFNLNAKVIDKNTMKTTIKSVSPKDRDKWITQEGLFNMFNKLKQDHIKNDYCKIGEDYLALIEDKGKTIYVIKDTNDIPKEVNENKLRPITYGELIYLSVADMVNKVAATVTRYPVTEEGSFYPTKLYLKSTVIGREVNVYIDGIMKKYNNFPMEGQKFFNSLSPHYSHLQRLGGDYDGDMTNLLILTTKEAVDEVNTILNSKEYYLSTNGKLTYSPVTTTLELVVSHLTS